jgi:hypothetical protein
MQTILTLPNGEASLHAQQSDQEFTLVWLNSGNWKLTIVDTSGSLSMEKSYAAILSCKECAAFLFIWANSDEENAELGIQYEILSEFLKNIPQHLRPIP